MHMMLTALLTSGAALLAAPRPGAPDVASPPTPTVAIERACAAAGGLEAFKRIGVLEVKIKLEEVTQDGHVTDTSKTVSFLTPGPTPAHIENPRYNVIAGDDGNGGWALVGGKPDIRPPTVYMVKRLVTTDLFPLLLPFSLTWEGVTVSEVVPAEAGGRPVWRLKVQLTPSFFHTPQISTAWTVDLDRRSFSVVEAESPATDLGKGVKADGMRFSWREPVTVKSVRLRGYQRVVGLDEVGREKSHSRIDRISYKLLSRTDGEKLFANPISPEMRVKPPVMQPPQRPGQNPGA